MFIVGFVLALFGGLMIYSFFEETNNKKNKSKNPIYIGAIMLIIGGCIIYDENDKEESEYFENESQEYVNNQSVNYSPTIHMEGLNDLRYRCKFKNCFCKVYKQELIDRRLEICYSCHHETAIHK